MDHLLRLIIGGLAIVGILMIGGYLSIRREPKDERAESFWKYSHSVLMVTGLIALVCTLAAIAFEIFWQITKAF